MTPARPRASVGTRTAGERPPSATFAIGCNMDEQLGVGGKAKRAVRRVVRYGGTEPLPLRLAVAVALAARNAGGGLSVGYRDRWCDGQDPSELFLLGVEPGNDLVLEATGPRAGELLDEVQGVMEGGVDPASSALLRLSDPTSEGAKLATRPDRTILASLPEMKRRGANADGNPKWNAGDRRRADRR